MIVNYFNYYVRPNMDLTFVSEDGRGCKGEYTVQFKGTREFDELNWFRFTVDNGGTKLLLWTLPENLLEGCDAHTNFVNGEFSGKRIDISAPSLSYALDAFVEIMDRILFYRLVVSIETKTFIYPYRQLPVRFKEVDFNSKVAKGYIDNHKSVLAFKPFEKSPYKIRVSTEKGVLQIDAKNIYDAQKWLRNSHTL